MRVSSIALRLAVVAAVYLSNSAQAAAPVAPIHNPVDGIRCDVSEGSAFHIHSHLTIEDHGKPVPVPEDVGRPPDGTCLYWVHVHAPDGIIHIESPKFRTFTLGDFFDIWKQPLTSTRVVGAKAKAGQIRAYVNGERFKGNPRSIELVQHQDIVIQVGPPYKTPSAFVDWNGQ